MAPAVATPLAPRGDLLCRAHDGATTYELFVSFTDGGVGTGTLRTKGAGRVVDQPVSVQSWKGSLLMDAPGSKNIVQTRGRLLQMDHKLQIGADWSSPWFDCDAM